MFALYKRESLYGYLAVKIPFIMLTCLFIINAFIFWPGQMSPDSYAQYEMARTGQFNDHHPPMMSLVWRVLDVLYPGSGLMFVFHLGLLYLATLFFMFCFTSPLRWWYLLLPLFPSISLYSSMIWKDVGFAFSFLCAVAVMSFYAMKRYQLSWSVLAFIVLLLLYGTGVKFQAQYILPLVALGIVYLAEGYRLTWRAFLYAISVVAAILVSIATLHTYLVHTQKVHTWQLVKLYDLAGISMQTNSPEFPSFIMQEPNFSLDAVRSRFNYERVDDLCGEGAPLRMGENEQERAELWWHWVTVILHHPQYYLWHRFCNWWQLVNGTPLQRFSSLDFSAYAGLGWFCQLQQYARQEFSGQLSYTQTIRTMVSKSMLALLDLVRLFLRLSLLLPFIIAYFMLGLWYWNKSNASMPLILMSSMSIALLITLFFFCMASNIRYAYIIFCLTHASHGFAWHIFKGEVR